MSSPTSPSNLSRSPSRRSSRLEEREVPIKRLGDWQLTQLTGRGSFTNVYMARPVNCRPNWPDDYAVKLLRHEFRNDKLALDSLRREVEVASQVTHQHLVTILESHLDDETKYVVMPRLEGVALSQVIEKVGYVSVRQALWIVRQVAEALHALHRRGWLHGDVKPQNVMLSTDGHATLIDLGFALRQSEAMLTELRTVRGTLNYVAPETMTSAYCSDERSDIYSLGITLFELLTGRIPFAGPSPGALIEAHREQPIPDPRNYVSDIPRDVVRLLSRMTAKQPLRRPQNVRALITELLPLEVAAMKCERKTS